MLHEIPFVFEVSFIKNPKLLRAENGIYTTVHNYNVDILRNMQYNILGYIKILRLYLMSDLISKIRKRV